MRYMLIQKTKHFWKSFIPSNLEGLGEAVDLDDIEDFKGATTQIFVRGTDTLSWCFLKGRKPSC